MHLKQQKALKEWSEIERNKQVYARFVEELICDLRGTLGSTGGLQTDREKMWRNYFQLCSSSAFTKRWECLLQSVGTTSTPILYQHLTDIIV